MIDFDVVGVTIDRGQHTILVVDDNPATRYATARVLRAAGFKTEEAASGEEALQKAGASISAVVLDVHLPDIDGFQVCQRLREQPSTAVLPVIHLSATYVEDRHKVAGLNAGADAYITHPAEPPILIATVQALVRARMAEDLLRGSEAKFRAIYTQAQSGIALIDSQGRFVDANPAMLQMLGRGTGDVVGQPVSAFAPPELREFLEDRIASAQGGSLLWQEAFPLLNAQGEPVHLEWSMSPHVEPGLRVGVASNVSEHVQLDQRRQQLLEREHAARVAAERHSRTRDDFIAVLSHELRNPLNAMVMAVHMLQRKGVPPDIAAGLDVIQRNAKTQARIISDILDVSRINSGKLALERELADPALLVHSSLDGMTQALEAKQLTLDTDVTPGAPIWLDPTRFQQVCWNIFSNAVKFSSPGGSIQVKLYRDEAWLTLLVRDFGIGMEAEFIDAIFEKFSQVAAPSKSAHAGLGLGMPIVKHLVELHAGSVLVQSDGPGLGTTVRVQIPVLDEPETATEPGLLDAGPREAGADLQGLDILVVEDDPQASEMLSLILRERGARVAVAWDYASALLAMESARPGILISDIGLGGLDGYDLVREIRRLETQSSRTAPVLAIALTAFGRIEDRDMALAAGFDTHIAKPLDPQELVTTLIRLGNPPTP